MHRVRRQPAQCLGRAAVQRAHGHHSLLDQRRLRALELDRGPDDAGAERLGEEQDVARLRAGIGEDSSGINRTGDRVAELDFPILDRVPSEERDTGPAQRIEAAAKNGADRRAIDPFSGEARNGERRQRTSAHRVDVAQRVGGSDLTIGVRIVDDRGKEIDRLHQRRSPLPPVHTRIVRGPEVHQDAVVDRCGDVTQHLSELACGEFARSTGAGDHLRQTLGHVPPFPGRVGQVSQRGDDLPTHPAYPPYPRSVN